ncbi:MAG: DUF2220 family protein [Thermotogota bacterium]|nr:DUF2220 family protein [Thermotogota bacterium]
MKNTQTIKKTLLKWPKKTIYLKELAGIIGKGRNQAYEESYADVKRLVQEGFLSPIPGSGTNGMNPVLENRYRVNLHNLPGIDELKAELLKLHVALKITYYQNHLDEYIRDREIVHVLNDYFVNGTSYQRIERRELAFMLFRKEKALDPSTKAYKVLNRLGLNLERNFNCFDRRLPVTYFPFVKPVKSVLIVENLTPFYDLFLIFRQINGQSKTSGFDALALGNGNHIVSAFEFFEDVFDDATTIDYYYWGDVDGAGLNIYLSLKKKYPKFKISLWEKAYEAMLQAGQWRDDSSKLNESPAATSDKCLSKLLNVAADGKAIPQEVLNFSALEELTYGE